MSAKEEHARNVDMHKMRRQHTELTKQNAALEAECASLKIATKDAFDKCSTLRETLTKQCTEKMNELKTEFENEKKRLNEQAESDAFSQRARHLDSFNEIKRQLESIYVEKMNEQNAAHEALMQQLKTERTEMEEHMARLAQDRHQAKMELDEVRARIKREEQAHIIRLVMELDSDREKMKCQLKEERKNLVEQLEKEDIEKREKNDNEIAEMKNQAEREINERMKELETEIQQLNNERDILLQKEESICALQKELKIAEERMNKQVDEERDKMKKQAECERQQAQNEAAAERRSNAQLLEKASQELDNKLKERVAENDARHNLLMQKVNNEREQIKQHLHELSRHKQEKDEQFNAIVGKQRVAFDETNRKLNDARDALKETDLRREKEHMELMKAIKLERVANADIIAKAKVELEHNHKLEMQKWNDERDALN